MEWLRIADSYSYHIGCAECEKPLAGEAEFGSLPTALVMQPMLWSSSSSSGSFDSKYSPLELLELVSRCDGSVLAVLKYVMDN
mgnify:FL=1